MSKTNALGKTSDVSGQAIKSLIGLAACAMGYDCDVFFPLTAVQTGKRVYGSYSNKDIYSNIPDLSENYVITGLIEFAFESDKSWDQYLPEVIMWLDKDKDIPVESKVIIKTGNVQFQKWKVSQPKGLIGTDQFVYKRYLLEPKPQ